MDILKVSFAVQSLLDSVMQIGGAAFPASTTVSVLVNTNSQYWIESDTNGNQHLCTCKVMGQSLEATFNNGTTAYSLKAVNFEFVEPLGLVGGRPIHRPHAY